MVGDRKHDVLAAHRHEIPAIGVLWGIGSERELRDAGADALADIPATLATLLAPVELTAVAPSSPQPRAGRSERAHEPLQLLDDITARGARRRSHRAASGPA